MAKGRMLDKEISESRKIAALPSDTDRMAYTFILPHVDREGRIEADAVLLSGKVFTRLPHMDADAVERSLQALAQVGLIVLYEVEGVRILQVTNFHEHNTPHHREPPSKFPPPDGNPGGNGESKHGPTKAEPRPKHGPSMDGARPPKARGIEVNRTEGKEKETPPTPPRKPESPEPQGREAFLVGLGNENPIQTLRRTEPTIHTLFEKMARLQRTRFDAKLAQAEALLGRIEARGAPAVEASLRKILETAGDGGQLFSRTLAHLDKQPTARPVVTKADHEQPVTGADLLDLDSPLGGGWGKN